MPTIRDVAKAAGVSVATVSRAFQERAPVSPEMRTRVRDAARALGYRPNQLARALAAGHSHAIGLLMPPVDGNPYYASLMAAVESEARAAGYETAVVLDPSGRPDTFVESVEALHDRQVDGCLIHGTEPQFARLSRQGSLGALPAVWMGAQPPAEVANVLPDEETAGYMATQHLLSLGHRRIACLCGRDEIRPWRREHGYLRALEQAGLEPIFAVTVPPEPVEARAVTHRLLDDHPDFTAMIACNDHSAFGVLRALAERGIPVPEDMSVVGYDNIPIADLVTPSLTTVDLAAEEVGRQAVRVLLERIRLGDRAPQPRRTLVPPRMVVRDTTGPPRGGQLRSAAPAQSRGHHHGAAAKGGMPGSR